MHRPVLRVVAFVTIAGCSRSAAPAPTPAPEPVAVPAATAPLPIPAAPAPLPTPTVPAPLPMPTAPSPGVKREYRGSYTRGFEASWFAPCGAPVDDALWWVTLTEDARLQRDSLLKAVTRPATGALTVRCRGTVSPRMPAGHMGRGTRYLLVTEVLEVRPLPSENGCPPTSRTS